MDTPDNDQSDIDDILARSSRDPQVFKELYVAFFPRVYNYFRLQTAEPDLADELAAITFEQAWLGMKKFHLTSETFNNWLFTIAQDLMVEQLRIQKQHLAADLEPSDNLPETSPAPVREMTQAEILEAICNLDEQQRNLVALKLGARMSNPEISKLTGMSEGDARDNLDRAMEILRAAPEIKQDPNNNLTAARPRSEPVDLDFSFESQIRQSLGERLAARSPTKRWSWRKSNRLSGLLSPLQTVAVAMVLILLLIALVIALNNLV